MVGGQGPVGGDTPVNPITEIRQLVPWHAQTPAHSFIVWNVLGFGTLPLSEPGRKIGRSGREFLSPPLPAISTQGATPSSSSSYPGSLGSGPPGSSCSWIPIIYLPQQASMGNAGDPTENFKDLPPLGISAPGDVPWGFLM